MMVNSDVGNILGEVVNSVAKVYGWKNYYKPVVKKLVPVADSLVDAYAGNYLLDRDSITISRQGSDVILTVNRVQTFKIYFTSSEDFFTRDINLEFKFEKDATGKVKDFYFKQGAQEMRVKRS
ncbi:MAG: hypothetical protein E6H06_10940 [Bacteroidetes bacterium]|nr:MAG: hypothetical protein E6H06_10940 [Bacteroidota bacterium]